MKLNKRIFKLTALALIQAVVFCNVSSFGFSYRDKTAEFCLGPSLHIDVTAVKGIFSVLCNNSRKYQEVTFAGIQSESLDFLKQDNLQRTEYIRRQMIGYYLFEKQASPEIASSHLEFEKVKKIKKEFNLKESLLKNKDYYTTITREGSLVFPAKYIWQDIGNLWVNWLGLIMSGDFNAFKGYRENIERAQLAYIERLQELIYGVMHNNITIEPEKFKLDVKILTVLLKLGLDYDWSKAEELVKFNLEYGKIRARNDSSCKPQGCYEVVTKQCLKKLNKFRVKKTGVMFSERTVAKGKKKNSELKEEYFKKSNQAKDKTSPKNFRNILTGLKDVRKNDRLTSEKNFEQIGQAI